MGNNNDVTGVSFNGMVVEGLEDEISTIVTEEMAGTGQPFTDGLSLVKNNTDESKQVRFDVGAISPGTTRTVSIPDQNFTLGPVISPPFSDATALVEDNVDSTKEFRIEVSAIAPATTRVMSVPNKDFIPASVNTAETFTGALTLNGTVVVNGLVDFTNFVEFLNDVDFTGIRAINTSDTLTIGGSVLELFTNILRTNAFRCENEAGTIRFVFEVPNSAIGDADLNNGEGAMYLNQAANLFIIKVKYSDGTVKTTSLALV